MRISKKQDKQIKMALSKQAAQIEPSMDLFNRIKKDINKQECGNTMVGKGMRFKKGNRVAIIAACCLLIGSITVLGVTMGRSWVGHTQIKYKTFPSQQRVLKDVGFIPKYTESLPDGFEYSNGGTGESTLTDDAGNVLTKTKDVTFSYKRGNEKSTLTLDITQIEEEFLDNDESEWVGDFNGINLYYYEKDYKFVPPNYELTEEDKRANEAGELEISYGTSEVSIENIQGLSWYEEGLHYMLMGSSQGFTIEEMIEIAKIIIQQ